jgi:hypothetical protein
MAEIGTDIDIRRLGPIADINTRRESFAKNIRQADLAKYSDHSGMPALRNPMMSRCRSSARRNG